MSGNHPARALNDDELARIDTLLEALNPDSAMVLEELDGFVCALACAAQPLSDAQAFSLACGAAEFRPDGDASHAELAALLRRHRLSIAAALHAGEGLEPIMERDASGASLGNLWAIGFLRGIDAQPDAWRELDENTQLAEWLESAEQLAEERDLETDMVVVPLERDRKALIDDMVEAAFAYYHHFEPQRRRASAPRTVRRDKPAPGRNEACACGSGRKYKQCCGAN